MADAFSLSTSKENRLNLFPRSKVVSVNLIFLLMAKFIRQRIKLWIELFYSAKKDAIECQSVWPHVCHANIFLLFV